MIKTEISVHATKHLFAKIKSLIREITANQSKRIHILDAPAGSGALTQFLIEEIGATVVALEIDLNKWQYQRIKPVIHDMNEILHFENQSFDMVICFEGLKHFGNVSQSIREFSRVLKPDGYLIVTIPNDLCMQSRLRYLFDGFVDTDWIHPMDPTSPNEKNFFHINSLVSLPYLYYFIIKSGLSYECSLTSRYRGWSLVAAIVLYPFVVFSTYLSCPPVHPLRQELRSLVWLAGRHNIVVAKKKT